MKKSGGWAERRIQFCKSLPLELKMPELTPRRVNSVMIVQAGRDRPPCTCELASPCRSGQFCLFYPCSPPWQDGQPASWLSASQPSQLAVCQPAGCLSASQPAACQPASRLPDSQPAACQPARPAASQSWPASQPALASLPASRG